MIKHLILLEIQNVMNIGKYDGGLKLLFVKPFLSLLISNRYYTIISLKYFVSIQFILFLQKLQNNHLIDWIMNKGMK